MALPRDDLPLLVCPSCRASLRFEGEARGAHLDTGALACDGCAARWPVVSGLPHLYREDLVRGHDRMFRVIYDAIPGLHDPLTTVLTPILQGVTEREARERVMRRLDLAALAPRPDRPLRILETGIGGGANLPHLRAHLGGRDVEIWGIDLSVGMLRECQKTIARGGYTGVRLLAADAHLLPFPDASFDRVFHVGGIGGYRDPRAALAEMARVAIPGTPIVVVDEQLDRGRRHSLFHRAAFRAITFWDPDPRSPRALLPEGAHDVIDEQMIRYYYCITFKMPVGPAR